MARRQFRRKLEQLAARLQDQQPAGPCRKPLVLAPPDLWPGARDEVEAMCAADAASPCLPAGCADCPDPGMRSWSTLIIRGNDWNHPDAGTALQH